MYDRKYSASLIIASKGMEDSETVPTPYGEIRSRSGALLKYTSNDARGVLKKWSKHNNMGDEAMLYLEDPTLNEVKIAISKINSILSKYPQDQTGIDLFFAGHGQLYTGAFIFRDQVITAYDFLQYMSEGIKAKQGKRGLSMILDSCYSGGFLIEIVLELCNNDYDINLYDALVSSMHSEKAYELSFLEHGAFSFTYLNSGNKHVNPKELSIINDIYNCA